MSKKNKVVEGHEAKKPNRKKDMSVNRGEIKKAMFLGKRRTAEGAF